MEYIQSRDIYLPILGLQTKGDRSDVPCISEDKLL